MKTHEITVTLRVRSKSSKKEVRKLLEATLCDTTNSHSYDAKERGQWVVKRAEGHIVAVDAGHDPCRLSDEPYMCQGHAYAQIVPWLRGQP